MLKLILFCQHLVKLEVKEVLVDPRSDEGHAQYTIHNTCCLSIFFLPFASIELQLIGSI